MIGRFLLGSGLGALVGTGLLALASVVSPPPAARLAADAPKPADAAAAQAPAPDDMAAAPTADPTAAPDVTAPAATDPLPDASPTAETEAPPPPAQGEAAEAPQTPAETGAPESPADPQSPSVPLPEAAPEAVAAPALAPLVPAPGPEALPEAPPVEDSAPAALPAEDATPAAPSGPAQPDVLLPEDAPSAAELPGPPPLTPEEEELLRKMAEGESLTPEVAPAPSADPGADPGAEPLPALDPAALPSVPQDKAAPGSAAPESPAQDAPGEGMGQLAPDPALPSAAPPPPAPEGVTTDRLPRIGDAPEAPDATAVAAEAPPEPPIKAHARRFDNPEAKPVFAIVLIDDGAETLDRPALAALPFPVSFALDPTHPKAADHAAIYRAAGQEVVMLASGLPQGAQASDVEVAMAAMARTLPESVALMDLPDAAFQSNRALAAMVVAVVGAQGRGLLTWDQGLNAADQVARRDDVPASVAFRDLDGADEAAPVIRRYLDRAAFKAQQDGRVTVVGRARPQTVAALLEWTVEGRAATVALAPLTAVLSVD